MGTQQVRLTDEAVDIIRYYAPTDSLSRGVLEMNRRLTTGSTGSGSVTTSNLQNVTYCSSNFSTDYWSKMQSLCSHSTNATNAAPTFQTANTLKKIGKIDPDEELQEPIGRQGRAL
jgi:hypothetical protein